MLRPNISNLNKEPKRRFSIDARFYCHSKEEKFPLNKLSDENSSLIREKSGSFRQKTANELKVENPQLLSVLSSRSNSDKLSLNNEVRASIRESSPNLSKFTEINVSKTQNHSSKCRKSDLAFGNDYQDVPARFGNHNITHRSANDPNVQKGQAAGRARHYEDIQSKFRNTHRRPKIVVPADFKEEARVIENQKITPDSLRFQLLEIRDKNELELLESYNQNVCLGKLRKKLWVIIRSLNVVCEKIIKHRLFEIVCLTIIIWNCIMLALSNPLIPDTAWQDDIDNFFLGFYTLEMTLKILGMGFIGNRKAYLRDYWNILDFVIVVTAFIPTIFSSSHLNLKPLRSLRVLRPLRTISSIRSLRNVVTTLLKAFTMLIDSLLIVFFVLFVYAIAGLQLFSGILKKRCFDPVTGRIYFDDSGNDIICGAKSCPFGYTCGKTTYNPENELSSFDTFTNSFVVVFQIITLEGWSTVLYHVMDAFSPITVIYFLTLVFIVSYFLLNITLAVIKAVFSMNVRSKGGPKEYDYDEHLRTMRKKAQVSITGLLKRYKNEHLVVAEKYELKPNGTIVENVPYHQNKFLRKLTTVSPILAVKKIVRGIKKLLKKSPSNEDNPPGPRDELFSPQMIESQRIQPLVSNNEPLLSPVSKRNSLIREDARMLKQFISSVTFTKKEAMEAASPVKQELTLKTFAAAGSLTPETKEQHIELPAKKLDKLSTEGGKPSIEMMIKDASNKNDKPGSTEDSKTNPIRPLISKFVMVKPQLSKSSNPLVGIAGIDKSTTKTAEKEKFNPEEFDGIIGENKNKTAELFQRGFNIQPKVRTVQLSDLLPARRASINLQKINQNADDTFRLSSPCSSFRQNNAKRESRNDLSIASELDSKIGNRTINTRHNSRKFTGTRKNSDMIDYIEERTKVESAVVDKKTACSEKTARDGEPNHEEDHIENLYEEKYYIDIRKLKLVPALHIQYESESYEAVLPKVFQRQRDQKLKNQMEKIRNLRPQMQYPLFLKTKGRELQSAKSDEGNGKSRLSSSTATVPIRKRLRVTSSRSVTSLEFGSKNNIKSTGDISNKLIRRMSMRSDATRRSTALGDPGEHPIKKRGTSQKDIFKALSATHLGISKPADEELKINFEDIRAKLNESLHGGIKKDTLDQLEKFEFEEKYIKLRENEVKKQSIVEKNFSATDTLKYKFIVAQLNSIRKSLVFNTRDYDIWHPGVSGLLKEFRNRVRKFTTTGVFGGFILLIVILNTFTLALDGAFTSDTIVNLFSNANLCFTIIFTIEMGLKIIGLGPLNYARDLMNLFDGVIVIISILEVILSSSGGAKAISAFRSARVLRTFRVLRVTRLLRSLAFMKIIIGVISRSFNSFMSIALLIFIMLFIYMLLGMQILGGNFNNPTSRSNYDSLFQAFLVTFQVMITENWNNILQTVFASSSMNKWAGVIYLFSWVVIGNWILLNLFLAIILDEFTSDEAKIDHKELGESNEIDEEDDAQLYTQYMAISSESQAHSVSKIASITSLPLSKRSINTNNSSVNNKSSINRNLSQEDFDLYEVSDSADQEKISKKKPLYQGIECEESFFLFKKSNKLRILFYRVYIHTYFEHAVMVVIVASSLKLAVETYFSSSNTVLNNMDYFFNVFFATEMLIKIISMGFILDKGAYLKDSWNMLDGFIVVTSLIDMSLSSVNISFIKILRMLRTLRPLRFVSHNESMKLVVNSLINSIPAILNVMIVLFMVWLMFAIFGVSLLQGKLGYCAMPSYDSYYGINLDQCLALGYTWKIEIINFENAGYGLLSVFTLATIEGYPDYLALCSDAADPDTGPIFNDYWGISLYYVIFLLLGSLFLMQLFTGVIFMKFEENQQEAKKKGRGAALTLAQQKWVDMQRLIISKKPDLFLTPPKQKIRRFAFFLIKEWGDGMYFDFIILAFIVANIFAMAMVYEGSSNSYDQNLTDVNYLFTAVFVMEAAFKIMAIGLANYWRDGWNKFDAFVVTSSLIDILVSILGNTLSFLRIGPQLIRVIRVLRVTRLFKLIRKLKGIQKILWVLFLSMPAILNLLALLFLVYFIFSVLAVFLFQNIIQGVDIDNDLVSFRNFGIAMITLFRCSTGEDWYKIMYDTWRPTLCSDGSQNCGQPLAPLFWISFMMVAQYIMVNMLMSVMIQEFENYYFSDDDLSLDKFKNNVRSFDAVWAKLSRKHDGLKIKSSSLITLFANLKKPLGFMDVKLDQHSKREEIAKYVMKMRIQCDAEDCVYFNDVLFATLKRVYEKYITKDADHAVLEFVRHQEAKTIRLLHKNKIRLSRRLSTIMPNPASAAAFNPLVGLIFSKLAFKAWLNYAKQVDTKQRECEEQGIAYVLSEDSDKSAESDSSFDDLSGSDSMMEEIPEGNSDEYIGSEGSDGNKDNPGGQADKRIRGSLDRLGSLQNEHIERNYGVFNEVSANKSNQSALKANIGSKNQDLASENPEPN